MLKRSLRIKVIAAIFSAAFLFGVSPAGAYTYSGGTVTIDQVAEDENDLVVTGGANVSSNTTLIPQKNKVTTTTNYKINTQQIGLTAVRFRDDNPQAGAIANVAAFITGLPTNIDVNIANEIIDTYKIVAKKINQRESDYFWIDQKSLAQGPKEFEAINKKYGYNINFLAGYRNIKYFEGYSEQLLNMSYFFYNLKYENGKWSYDTSQIDTDLNPTIPTDTSILKEWFNQNYTKSETINLKTYEHQDASITVSNKSTLSSTGNIQTSKDISVTGTSKLTATTGTIKGDNITSDGDIIAQSNYSAPDGKSTISGATINSTGTLTASKDIKATTGSISSTVIKATGGNVIANNSIKATGKVKGNALNVGVINASSASITGNQSISGIFTTVGQAKLNGGAVLGGKKITGLSIGTLSTTSTDAVNGKQLYTAMQSSGKTYTAGSDISISSANAISIAKAGKVASGDTGIMTGNAVYQETSKIDSVFKSHNTSITSNNSKLDSLTTSIESLRKSLGTINSSVSDAISGLPGSLANFANKDLTDLSDTGINTLKSYIKSEIKKQIPSNSKTTSYAIEATVTKDTTAIDNVITSKANASDLTALGSKVDSKADKSDVSLVEDRINDKADLGYVNDGLAKKGDKSIVETVSGDVAKNTSAIAKNTEFIQSNTEAVSGLKDSKADVSGSNIDVFSWNTKLGNGTIAKDDTGLVTGNSAASALDKKADIGYVTIGLGAMESSLDQMSQQVTKDVSRVGAEASALMGLHPTGDKFEFATACGHYKNSNNTALGVFYKPSANSTVSVAGTIGDGDAMLSAGVSIKLGLNKEVKKVITPKEFGTMKSTVDSQDEKLDQMEKTLQQMMAR